VLVPLEVDPGQAPAAWDEAVCQCGGSVFHSSAWAGYVTRRQLNTSPVRFRWLGAHGETVGVALGFRTRSPNRFTGPLTSRLWFDAWPAVRGVPGAADAFLDAIEQHARAAGDVELAFGSFAHRGGADLPRERHYSLHERLEFELDLRPGLDDLFHALEAKRRRNVSKSRRLGVVVDTPPTEEGLVALHRLRAMTWNRLREKGVAMPRPDDLQGPAERVLLDAGVARLVGARLGGTWIAVTLFTCFAGQAYQMLPAHAPEALEVQAPTLLLWESLARFKAEGVQWFNLGGCSASARNPDDPEHGVYNYKRAFGGACLECASGRLVLKPVRMALAHALRRIVGR
jgi:CelD/BcsL family acetyltransferase involved in cellulose biosynthesis